MARSKYTYAILGFGFIVFCLILLTGNSSSQESSSSSAPPQAYTQQPPVINTEDVVTGRFYGRGANATWVGDEHLTWVSASGDLVLYSVKDGGKRIVVKADQFQARPWKVKFSGDKRFVLVGFEPRRMFRSTILARYAVHDAGSGTLIQELRTTEQSTLPESFQLAVWGNDHRTVLCVFKNDVYAIRLEERHSRIHRITTDGADTLYNGIADWVYEEEVFTSSSDSVFSSSEGTFVAYIKFNDSVVQPVNYNLYGDYVNNDLYDPYFQYHRYGTVRYPKSGTANPSVSVHIVRLGDDDCWGTPSSNGGEDTTTTMCTWDFSLDQVMERIAGGRFNRGFRYILGSFKWLDHEHKFVMNVLNRVQNTSWVVEGDADARQFQVVHMLTKSNGWIDASPLIPLNSEYLTLSSVAQHNGLEYIHVTAVSSNRVRFLTRGTFSVDEIAGVYANKFLIFKSPLVDPNPPRTVDSTQAHYYALDLTSQTPAPPQLTCLTCRNNCTYNTLKFSEKLKYFTHTCDKESDVAVVSVCGIRTEPILNVEELVVLERNAQLRKALSPVVLPEVEYRVIPYSVLGKEYIARVRIVGPRGWKLRRNKSYPKLPVIVDVYGGPNSQKVTRKFSPNDWSYALASHPQFPVVYVTVDGIGSGRESSSMAYEVYRNLGDKEIHDKIYVLKHLLAKHDTLDPERTLIWGWSYGGYLSAMVMGKDTDHVFKCGISVAPVVNWHYYDTIYTERYMSTPEDNPGGYNSSSVIRYVEQFEGKPYLLIHGNADDNVHYQQSMVLARALEQRGILFRMQSYPDENHSLGGVRPHLFRTLEDFVFNTCFSGVGK